MAISRRLTHVFVLLLVLAISGYASFDRHLPAGLSLELRRSPGCRGGVLGVTYVTHWRIGNVL